MNDIKIEFKQWLQKNFSKSTANTYCGLVQKIFSKNFGSTQNWQDYSDSVMPLLARYFELANRGYALDCVTITYALDYFDKISKFIYPKQVNTYKDEPTVKIFTRKSPSIYETTLYELSNCLK